MHWRERGLTSTRSFWKGFVGGKPDCQAPQRLWGFLTHNQLANIYSSFNYAKGCHEAGPRRPGKSDILGRKNSISKAARGPEAMSVKGMASNPCSKSNTECLLGRVCGKVGKSSSRRALGTWIVSRHRLAVQLVRGH